MALQLSVPVRNARLDSIEATCGISALLKLYTGAVPATTATADAGTVLVSMTLPSDWMSNAASGSKALLGSWTGTGVAVGTAAHFRVTDSTGATAHIQGTVTITGGGGDMTLDNTSIATGQTVTVTTFSLTDANA